MLNALIIGCGDIGIRVAQSLQQQNYALSAIVRSHASAARLTTLDISTTVMDLDHSPFTLPPIDDDTLLFYFAPPAENGEHDSRMGNFLRALTAAASSIDNPCQPARVIYISTTAVYGESNGHWVNEQSPTRPNSARGKRRLSAERQLIDFQSQYSIALTILRVAGIYSAKQLPLQQIKAGKPILQLAIAPYSNRIHAIDLAEICVTAAHSKTGSLAIFNASDGNPGSISQYYQQVALTFGLPTPPGISWEVAQQQLSAAMLSYLKESKRIDSTLLMATLDISLRYPTLEAGLRQCAEELRKP